MQGVESDLVRGVLESANGSEITISVPGTEYRLRFAQGGATADDSALMRATVGDELGVKASGGVRSAAVADAMVAAGANRLGASSSVAIVSGARMAMSGLASSGVRTNWESLAGDGGRRRASRRVAPESAVAPPPTPWWPMTSGR
jgi:hypothetical protein